VFQADGSSYATPATFSWIAGSKHMLTLPGVTDVSAARLKFNNWFDGQVQPLREVTVPNTPLTMTATYSTYYEVRLQANPITGGTVSASPASSDGYYMQGSLLTITATPAAQYRFAGFSGNLSGTANAQSLHVYGPRSVTANFTSLLQNPVIAARIANSVTRAAQPGPAVTVALQFRNSGLAARKLRITALSARALAPTVAILVVDKALPELIGDLASGATSPSVNVPVSIPSTATRVVLAIAGTVEDQLGRSSFFNTSVTILR
jgi:hypothetical protein